MNSGKVAGENGNIYKGTLCFDPADRIYGDHFPGNPVVPGSLIVHAFMEAGRKMGIAPGCCAIENFTFREFVPPGAYPFSMEPLPDRLKCRLYQGDRTLATGILKI